MRLIFPRSVKVSNLRIFLAALTVLAACAGPAKLAPNLILETDTINRDTVAFSLSADLLGSGAANGDVTLWSLPDGKTVRHWRAHTGSVHGLAFLAGDRLVSASYDKTIALWERDGTLRLRRATPAPIAAMAVYEAQDLLVTGHDDGAIRRWRLADLQPLSEMRVHRGGVRALAYHPSGLYASSGYDGATYVWRAGETPRALARSPSDARGLVFAPDAQVLYGSGWFKLFRWHVADGTLAVLPTEHHGVITSLDLTADGRRLASISRQTDSAVQLLDPATGATLVRFQSHELCGTHVRLSLDGRYLASTSDDATVRVWDLTKTAGSP